MEDPWKKHRPGALKHCHIIGNNFPFCGGGGRGLQIQRTLVHGPSLIHIKSFNFVLFFFFFQDCFGYAGCLAISEEFENQFFNFYKEVSQVSNRN